MPVNSPIGKTLKRHAVLIAVVAILVILIGGYLAGYRPGPGLTLVRVGTLVVTGVPDGTAVYADQAYRGNASNGSLTAALVPGNHTIIIGAPNEQPVEQLVSIESSKTTTISPILVSMKPGEVNLSAADTASAKTALADASVPTQANPLSMGCALVYVSENRVMAEAATSSPACATPPDYLCTGGTCAPTIIYAPSGEIHSIFPFPGRTDAFIISTGEWIYAIGLDPRTPQYFAPLMHGFAPIAAPASGSNTIYVKDQSDIFGVQF